MHRDVEAHETALSVLAIETGADQAPGAATAGVVLRSARPSASTATHSPLEGQETELSATAPSIATGLHAAGPAAGLVLTIALPSLSTATQSAAEGQEIELSAREPSIAKADHDPAPPVGWALTATRPASSTAAHSAIEGHEIARSAWPPSTSAGPDQLSAGAAPAGIASTPTAHTAAHSSRASFAGARERRRITSDATPAARNGCGASRQIVNELALQPIVCYLTPTMSTSDNKVRAAGALLAGPGNGDRADAELDLGLDESLTLAGETRYSQSLDRGLAILMCFTPERPLLGIAELASMLRMSRSTTHRYVITLVALGYLSQGERRKYHLALRVTELGMSAMNSTGLREHARPYLEDLSRRSGHAVSIAILDGPEVLCVDSVQGRRGRRLGEVRAGADARLPVHCTAAGKLLAAYLPASERRSLISELKLQRHGLRTIVSKRALRAELDAIPEEGLASSAEELVAGLLEIAAPVRAESREVVAAVVMSAHSSTISLDVLLDALGPHLVSTADRIAARLGYRRDDEREWGREG
jgi:DNA-binding IclR family transcriptional regulator